MFTLLQNLYAVFDRSARKLGVFKVRRKHAKNHNQDVHRAPEQDTHFELQVETIGDSYVAVTGLPDPQKNHAVIMARFAMECRSKMKHVTKKLVQTLGPETEDLRMRFGLHSGKIQGHPSNLQPKTIA